MEFGYAVCFFGFYQCLPLLTQNCNLDTFSCFQGSWMQKCINYALIWNPIFTLSGMLSLSRLINFFWKPVSERSSFAVAQFGFFCNRIHTAFMTVSTRKEGRVWTLQRQKAHHSANCCRRQQSQIPTSTLTRRTICSYFTIMEPFKIWVCNMWVSASGWCNA